MKNSTIKSCTIAILLFLLPTLVCTACMLLFCFDRTLLFFTTGPALWMYRALLLLGLLYAGLLLLLLRQRKEPLPLPERPIVRLISGICGFFLCAIVPVQILCTVLAVDCGKYDIAPSRLGLLLHLGNKATILGSTQIVALVLAIPAGIYFLLSGFSRSRKKSPRILLGCTAVLWSLAQALLANFYVEAFPMNSPLRLMPMVAGVFTALYLLAELRCLVGRGKLGLLMASGFLAIASSLIYVLTELLLTILGTVAVGLSTIYALIYLLLSLYIIARMIATGKTNA